MLQTLAMLGAVFLSVGLFAGAIAWPLVTRLSPERQRFDALARHRRPRNSEMGSILDRQAGLTGRFARFIPKSPAQLGHVRRRLASAGYYSVTAVIVFSLARWILPLVLGLTALAIFGTQRFLFAVFAAVVGFLLPGLVLERLVKRRKKLISNGLPDALDLLIVCLEAGSALDQAIVKVTEELAITHPALAEEFKLVNVEMRAGKPRIEAFKNFAKRTGVDDVRSLVSMLMQTDRFGTSIGQALRVHAATSRTKRRQRAEERAGKIGVKLVFPLVFCLFPAFYVVTLGPAVIDFLKFFSQR